MNKRGHVPDIWVTRNGLVLFEHHADKSMDMDIMGSLFSAIDSIASLIDGDGISSMDIGKKKMIVHKRSGITFIVASSAMDKKAMDRYVKKIAGLFFETYPERFVSNWDGDCTPFQNFVVPAC